MQQNPFTPPSEVADQAAETALVGARPVKLYTPNQVALASFIGAPLGGFWLIAANYRVLGKDSARMKAIATGVLSTVAILSLGLVLPENFPRVVVPAAYTFGMKQLAIALQGIDIANLTTSGKHSTWRAAGVGFLCFIGMMAVVMAADLLLDH